MAWPGESDQSGGWHQSSDDILDRDRQPRELFPAYYEIIPPGEQPSANQARMLADDRGLVCTDYHFRHAFARAGNDLVHESYVRVRLPPRQTDLLPGPSDKPYELSVQPVNNTHIRACNDRSHTSHPVPPRGVTLGSAARGRWETGQSQQPHDDDSWQARFLTSGFVASSRVQSPHGGNQQAARPERVQQPPALARINAHLQTEESPVARAQQQSLSIPDDVVRRGGLRDARGQADLGAVVLHASQRSPASPTSQEEYTTIASLQNMSTRLLGKRSPTSELGATPKRTKIICEMAKALPKIIPATRSWKAVFKASPFDLTGFEWLGPDAAPGAPAIPIEAYEHACSDGGALQVGDKMGGATNVERSRNRAIDPAFLRLLGCRPRFNPSS